MTDDPSNIAGTFASRRMLVESEKAMEDILAAFELMSERMLDGEFVTMAEVTSARRALAQARSQLVAEVNKHEKRVLFSNGGSGGSTLDLDAIRSEIGGSLDRIRNARGTEGIC